MIEKQLQATLRELTEQNMPNNDIDLWPAIQSIVVKRREADMYTHQKRIFQRRLAISLVLIVMIVGILFFATPMGQVAAQNILRFFRRSDSNQLPLQSWQLTPSSLEESNPTSDPASIIDAHNSIEEIQQQTGFHVFVPSWVPENLTFSGASIEEENNIARLFYQSVETNGLVLRQELIPMTDTCALCGKVGADAAIQEVSINGGYGEFVIGVWELTDEGSVWKDEPYLKTMRWQEEGMAFELLYMGMPDALSMEDMIAIAESIN